MYTKVQQSAVFVYVHSIHYAHIMYVCIYFCVNLFTNLYHDIEIKFIALISFHKSCSFKPISSSFSKPPMRSHSMRLKPSLSIKILSVNDFITKHLSKHLRDLSNRVHLKTISKFNNKFINRQYFCKWTCF